VSKIELSQMHRPSPSGDQVVREEVTAMKLGTFGRLATVLLLVGIVAVSATGCVLVPYPVGGYGHYDHHGR
jgi:hypothetical protein